MKVNTKSLTIAFTLATLSVAANADNTILGNGATATAESGATVIGQSAEGGYQATAVGDTGIRELLQQVWDSVPVTGQQ